MNEDYCVICGNYIGENNKMYCQECEKKYLKNDEKDLTNELDLWYNIDTTLRKK